MEPLSGNQRPDLLTALKNMSLVLRTPPKIYFCRSSTTQPPRASQLRDNDDAPCAWRGFTIHVVKVCEGSQGSSDLVNLLEIKISEANAIPKETFIIVIVLGYDSGV